MDSRDPRDYVPLFGASGEINNGIQAGSGPLALVQIEVNGKKICGRLRHINKSEHHFGLQSPGGQNLGHFGWETTINGFHVYRKTKLPPKLPPNRKYEILRQFVDVEDALEPGETLPEDGESFLRNFLLWMFRQEYDVVSNGERLDMESLLMEYLNRRG